MIDGIKTKFHPKITSYQLKEAVEITELIDQTATSIVRLAQNPNSDSSDTFHLLGKFGVDGSVSHKNRQQLINASLAAEGTSHLDPTKLSSIVLSCYCPPELCCGEKLLWSNPVPNSTS